MTENKERLYVTRIFLGSCNRQVDCPIQKVLADLSKTDHGSLDFKQAEYLSRLRGLTQVMDTSSMVFNGNGFEEARRKTLVMSCLQGNTRDGDFRTCGTLVFTYHNGISENSHGSKQS